MRNTVYACNLENEFVEICGEINRDRVRYLTTHAYNGAIKEKLVLANVLSSDGGNSQQIKAHTFSYPDAKKGKIVTKRKTTKKLSYLNHGNEQFCYTLNNDDMNLVKIEQKNIFIKGMGKPKTKKPRQKKYVRRIQMANSIEWEGLSFQQEIEAEYHCNVKPNDYAQYLNNPQQDPMFCQFDVHAQYNRDEQHYYNFYMGK